MRRLRRAWSIVALVVLCACTPTQVQRWWDWHARDPVAADAWVDYLRTNPPPGECAEYYWNALEAGFTNEQWPVVDQIMFGESRCDPHADSNLSSARGLMQILEGWTGGCGITYEMFYDPQANLNCAKHVYDLQGWNAWSAWDGHGP